MRTKSVRNDLILRVLRTDYVRNTCYHAVVMDNNLSKTVAGAARSGSAMLRPFRIEIPQIDIDDLRDLVSRPLEFCPVPSNNFNARRERNEAQ
ncbi:MAG: hypothetical protein ACREDR_12590 [Blastocatellia bacterium]